MALKKQTFYNLLKAFDFSYAECYIDSSNYVAARRPTPTTNLVKCSNISMQVHNTLINSISVEGVVGVFPANK